MNDNLPTPYDRDDDEQEPDLATIIKRQPASDRMIRENQHLRETSLVHSPVAQLDKTCVAMGCQYSRVAGIRDDNKAYIENEQSYRGLITTIVDKFDILVPTFEREDVTQWWVEEYRPFVMRAIEDLQVRLRSKLSK